MSSKMATDAERERIAVARSEQKRAAARDFLQSAVMPLIEDVLVKKFCQTMDVIAEEREPPSSVYADPRYSHLTWR